MLPGFAYSPRRLIESGARRFLSHVAVGARIVMRMRMVLPVSSRAVPGAAC